MKLELPLGLQQWVFWAFFLGFAIKVPMFPFHTWLPDAHVEAPTAGSVILASVLLKMGTYGFIRFSLPLLPRASADQTIVQILAVLSIIGIVYGALVSLMQQDWKKLVAYSSVSHLGFCTLGIFALNPNGLAGSMIQQVNHGISTGMLFLVIGVIYERRHTREISEYGGLAHVMPKFAVIFAIAMLSSAGLPLLNGFVGEFTILQGAFEANRIWAAFAVTGVILGAAYLLWLYQRTMLGQVTNGKNLGHARYEPARDRGLPAADRLGRVDRHLSQALLRRAAAAGLGDCGARAAGIFRECRSPRRSDARPDDCPAGRRPMSQFYTTTDHFTIVPALMLALFGCAILLFDFLIFPDPRQRKYLLIFVALAEGFTGFALYRQMAYLAANGLSELTGFQGSVTIDGFGIFFNWIFVAAAMIVAMVSYQYLEIAGEHHGEYYSLILFAQCGMFFLATGTDLVTLFIGLELMALCFYVMVGFLRTDKRSNEAAMKYLLLGAFSSGFLVYGFSVMYGIAGSTKLADIAAAIAARAAVGSGGFPGAGDHLGRAAVQDLRRAVPHVGAGRLRRRAYHGDGLSFGGVEGRFDRVSAAHLPGPAGLCAREVWEPMLAVVAVLTLTIGNLAAINQTNIKRLLAYSSISHAGYMLLGLVAGNATGINGIAVYMMVYTFIESVAPPALLRHSRTRNSGLARRKPVAP